jgi:hypothetical protein
MFRTCHLITAMSLPLLVAGCSDESSPPSGLNTEPPPQAALRALATEQSRFRLRDVGAEVEFFSFDPTGCIVTDVFVFGAERQLKASPGKATEGPLAVVLAFQLDVCSNTVLRDVFGQTLDASIEADRAKLGEARLQATVTGVDFVTDEEVQIEVDVAWTGAGGLTFQSQQNRVRQPGFLARSSIKGVFRDAIASGTISLAGENLATDSSLFADIFRVKVGQLELVRTGPAPPDSATVRR